MSGTQFRCQPIWLRAQLWRRRCFPPGGRICSGMQYTAHSWLGGCNAPTSKSTKTERQQQHYFAHRWNCRRPGTRGVRTAWDLLCAPAIISLLFQRPNEWACFWFRNSNDSQKVFGQASYVARLNGCRQRSVMRTSGQVLRSISWNWVERPLSKLIRTIRQERRDLLMGMPKDTQVAHDISPSFREA